MKQKIPVTFFLVLTFFITTNSYAGWELYDNFSSGSIDTQKWRIEYSSANITVQNGRAKFEHLSGNPNDPSYLIFNQNPETIKGIKVTISSATCVGDVRVRIGAYVGGVGVSQVWSALELQPNDERIYTYAGLEGPPPNYIWLYDLHYAHFENPIQIIGRTFTVSKMFYPDKIVDEVDGYGKITHKYETPLTPLADPFMGIGTRSDNGDGPCIAYFDNVYVYLE